MDWGDVFTNGLGKALILVFYGLYFMMCAKPSKEEGGWVMSLLLIGLVCFFAWGYGMQAVDDIDDPRAQERSWSRIVTLIAWGLCAIYYGQRMGKIEWDERYDMRKKIERDIRAEEERKRLDAEETE